MSSVTFDKMMRTETGVRLPVPALTTTTLLRAKHVMAVHDDTTSRRCFLCGEVKLLDEFVKAVRYRCSGGRRGFCKVCARKRDSERSLAKYEKKFLETYVPPIGVIAPDTVILDDCGRDWAWAFVVFRGIRGCPDRVVGSDGSVWRLYYGRWWKKVELKPQKRGYLTVSLPGRKRPYLHHVMLETFIGPRPDGMEGCHNDGNPLNNAIVNLRWDTRRGNFADKVGHGTSPRGENNGHAIVTEAIVRIIRQCHRDGMPCKDISVCFGITCDHARQIVNRVTWKHVE